LGGGVGLPVTGALTSTSAGPLAAAAGQNAGTSGSGSPWKYQSFQVL